MVWIAKADDRLDRLGQSDVTANASAQALADQHDRAGVSFAQCGERGPVGFDELGQPVGAFTTF